VFSLASGKVNGSGDDLDDGANEAQNPKPKPVQPPQDLNGSEGFATNRPRKTVRFKEHDPAIDVEMEDAGDAGLGIQPKNDVEDITLDEDEEIPAVEPPFDLRDWPPPRRDRSERFRHREKVRKLRTDFSSLKALNFGPRSHRVSVPNDRGWAQNTTMSDVTTTPERPRPGIITIDGIEYRSYYSPSSSYSDSPHTHPIAVADWSSEPEEASEDSTYDPLTESDGSAKEPPSDSDDSEEDYTDTESNCSRSSKYWMKPHDDRLHIELHGMHITVPPNQRLYHLKAYLRPEGGMSWIPCDDELLYMLESGQVLFGCEWTQERRGMHARKQAWQQAWQHELSGIARHWRVRNWAVPMGPRDPEEPPLVVYKGVMYDLTATNVGLEDVRRLTYEQLNVILQGVVDSRHRHPIDISDANILPDAQNTDGGPDDNSMVVLRDIAYDLRGLHFPTELLYGVDCDLAEELLQHFVPWSRKRNVSRFSSLGTRWPQPSTTDFGKDGHVRHFAGTENTPAEEELNATDITEVPQRRADTPAKAEEAETEVLCFKYSRERVPLRAESSVRGHLTRWFEQYDAERKRHDQELKRLIDAGYAENAFVKAPEPVATRFLDGHARFTPPLIPENEANSTGALRVAKDGSTNYPELILHVQYCCVAAMKHVEMLDHLKREGLEISDSELHRVLRRNGWSERVEKTLRQQEDLRRIIVSNHDLAVFPVYGLDQQDGDWENGVRSNREQVNGVQATSVQPEGARSNGVHSIGVQLGGIYLNGQPNSVHVNGGHTPSVPSTSQDSGGVHLNGVHLDGGQSNGGSADGDFSFESVFEDDEGEAWQVNGNRDTNVNVDRPDHSGGNEDTDEAILTQVPMRDDVAILSSNILAHVQGGSSAMDAVLQNIRTLAERFGLDEMFDQYMTESDNVSLKFLVRYLRDQSRTLSEQWRRRVNTSNADLLRWSLFGGPSKTAALSEV